jgi:hypothetical protein
MTPSEIQLTRALDYLRTAVDALLDVAQEVLDGQDGRLWTAGENLRAAQETLQPLVNQLPEGKCL